MSRPKIRIFSAKDRAAIQRQAVGKPTGVVLELGGFEFDLLPLTTSQGFELLRMFNSLPELAPNADGTLQINGAALARIVSVEGRKVMEMARELLLDSARAGGMISDDEGEAVFNEWFDGLELLPTLKALVPKVIEANGLGDILGNAAAPAAAPPAATSQE